MNLIISIIILFNIIIPFLLCNCPYYHLYYFINCISVIYVTCFQLTVNKSVSCMKWVLMKVRQNDLVNELLLVNLSIFLSITSLAIPITDSKKMSRKWSILWQKTSSVTSLVRTACSTELFVNIISGIRNRVCLTCYPCENWSSTFIYNLV